VLSLASIKTVSVQTADNYKKFELMRMKFSAWNVDFSSSSPDPLDSCRPAHVGVNERYPCKKWLFILCCLSSV